MGSTGYGRNVSVPVRSRCLLCTVDPDSHTNTLNVLRIFCRRKESNSTITTSLAAAIPISLKTQPYGTSIVTVKKLSKSVLHLAWKTFIFTDNHGEECLQLSMR